MSNALRERDPRQDLQIIPSVVSMSKNDCGRETPSHALGQGGHLPASAAEAESTDALSLAGNAGKTSSPHALTADGAIPSLSESLSEVPENCQLEVIGANYQDTTVVIDEEAEEEVKDEERNHSDVTGDTEMDAEGEPDNETWVDIDKVIPPDAVMESKDKSKGQAGNGKQSGNGESPGLHTNTPSGDPPKLDGGPIHPPLPAQRKTSQTIIDCSDTEEDEDEVDGESDDPAILGMLYGKYNFRAIVDVKESGSGESICLVDWAPSWVPEKDLEGFTKALKALKADKARWERRKQQATATRKPRVDSKIRSAVSKTERKPRKSRGMRQGETQSAK